MKKQEKLKNLILEVINLIVTFFKPYSPSDEVLDIPKNLKRMGTKVNSMDLVMTLIGLTFAFILKAVNLAIQYRLILLGIILFMLYRGQRIADEAFNLFEDSERKKLKLIFDDERTLRASQIVSKSIGKVLKYDASNKIYKLMSNESMLNTIKHYLQNLWQLKMEHIFDVFRIISVIVMLVVAVLTNTSISQILFVPLIVAFVVISFLSSAYISLYRGQYYEKYREYNNEQSVVMNDLLRVPTIVEKDLEMRFGKLYKSIKANNQNVARFHNKLNLSKLIVSVLEVVSQYGIIIIYLLGVDWDSISLATITEITATLLIVETALRQISMIASTLNGHREMVIVLEKEKDDVELILEVYHNETTKNVIPKSIDNIMINPFSIRYLEESENDKPFTLVSKKPIRISSGQIAILYGPSGSGKSTFMKMLTERIRIEKSTDIPSTSHFLFYDEKLKFGSLSIFEELFCCSENPDLTKMQTILENLHLWNEIKSNCIDVWQWMKEKKFDQALSNGQKQRLILAKMLYWLDDNIDVLVLDECTSGLDDKSSSDSADAERILEYIVKFANSDKKRIIIISTHQNIDGFKQKIADEYSFKNLQFEKEGECNLVKEI